jgi:hypothetical protein
VVEGKETRLSACRSPIQGAYHVYAVLVQVSTESLRVSRRQCTKRQYASGGGTLRVRRQCRRCRVFMIYMHKSYIPPGAIQRNSSTRPECQNINTREPCCSRESLCTKTQMKSCSFVRKPLLVNARARILTSKVAVIVKVVHSMTFPVLALCVTVQQKNPSLAQSARIAKHAAHHRPFAVW